MYLKERITLLVKLREYLAEQNEELNGVIKKAWEKNNWFTEEFIKLAIKNITECFLDSEKLNCWIEHYHIDDNIEPRKVGVVMAGNIPLVGFHDFLSVFVTGHRSYIKLSEKDDVLLKHIIEKMCAWNPKVTNRIYFADLLKDCDAYIATGSNNSSRYFHYYFDKYPSVIRTNKTSVAILSGNETQDELALLADDVFTYFGLGCRNVSSLFVPHGYDFQKLLTEFDKYGHFADITKYRNNYDYNLALLIMNNQLYMSNKNIILVENKNVFSPVSELHYSFYRDRSALINELKNNENIQCIVGAENIPFGTTQKPGLFDYADGIDTMQFLLSL